MLLDITVKLNNSAGLLPTALPLTGFGQFVSSITSILITEIQTISKTLSFHSVFIQLII